jgi:ribosomal protein S18 acetylase RimI-like enzyme
MTATKPIHIRQCSWNDIGIIRTLSIQTFKETFELVNTAENMRAYIENNLSQTQLENEFNEHGSHFAIALSGKTPVGFLKLRTGFEPEELKKNKPLEIERLYSIKDYIGRNVGQQLMRYCIEFGTKNNFNMLWLGVWELNTRAIAFYQKFGFQQFSQHAFMLGHDRQIDLLMKKELHPL